MTKPLDLAQGAVKASLARARTLSAYLKTLEVQLNSSSASNNRQRLALKDCVEQISDSVAELNRTLNELQHMSLGKFQWQMSNAQTWASAVLTNGNSCIDGVNHAALDANLKLDVKRRVNGVAMLTSNALYLIHQLLHDTTGKPRINSQN
jgi:pectinesterase inhibitor-like protein